MASRRKCAILKQGQIVLKNSSVRCRWLYCLRESTVLKRHTGYNRDVKLKVTDDMIDQDEMMTIKRWAMKCLTSWLILCPAGTFIRFFWPLHGKHLYDDISISIYSVSSILFKKHLAKYQQDFWSSLNLDDRHFWLCSMLLCFLKHGRNKKQTQEVQDSTG